MQKLGVVYEEQDCWRLDTGHGRVVDLQLLAALDSGMGLHGVPHEAIQLSCRDSMRVIRGGDWNDYHEALRSAVRFNIRPTERFNQQGLRVVLALPLKENNR